MKSIYSFIFIFVAVCLFNNKTAAQIGDSSTHPYILTANISLDSVPLDDTITWFSYTATEPVMNIYITYPKYKDLGSVRKAMFYSGMPPFLTLVDSLPERDPVNSLLSFYEYGLTISTTYYIKTIQKIKHKGSFSIVANSLNVTNGCVAGSGCNLCQNGDFESYTTCPHGFNQVPYSCFWVSPAPAAVLLQTPDYFVGSASCNPPSSPDVIGVPNNYFGQQAAHSGNAYAGIFIISDFPGAPNPNNGYREYIEEPLSHTLGAGTYVVTFYVALPQGVGNGVITLGATNPIDGCAFASDRIGAYLSKTDPNSDPLFTIASNNYNNPLIYNGSQIFPQVQSPPGAPVITNTSPVNWKMIQGTFTTSGGENYITIGNFYISSQTTTTHVTNDPKALGNYDGYTRQSYYYIDDISVTPLITASITNTNVSCNGGNNGSATVTGNGGVTPYIYSWNTFPIQTNATATGLTAGTYTATVTDQNGCTGSATVTITQPLPITVIVSQNNVTCNGGNNGSSLAIASGGTSPYSYLWTTIPVQTNAKATGLTAGAYTVTVTDKNGCMGTASVTIFQAPPLTITPTASLPNPQCAGTPFNLSATVSGGAFPYSYVWQPGNLHGSPVSDFFPGSSINYTVTVTDHNGCTGTAQVTVTGDPNCCYVCFGGFSVPGGSLSTTYGTGFTSNGCITISGPGAFTIPTSTTFTITTCNIAISAGVTIVVKSGATLDIDNSRLYACGNMWQGILVESGGSLIVRNGSTIEDAIIGCEVQSSSHSTSSISVTSSLLNNNLYDIQMDPSISSVPRFYLAGSTLTCQADPGYSNNAYLKAPNLGLITNSGVYLNNVVANPLIFFIGDYSSGLLTNTFSNMNYGVNAISSSFSVYNNVFDHLKGLPYLCKFPTVCPGTGIAVLADGSTGPSNTNYSINVGGSLAHQLNQMTNCWRGVDITAYAYVVVANNQMSNTNNEVPITNPTYGDHGVYIKASKGAPFNTPTSLIYQIINNNINNFTTGIHTFGMPQPFFSHNGTGNITNNVLKTSGVGGMNIGILDEYPSSVSFPIPQLNITTNQVYNAAVACIELKNALSGVYTLIDKNTPLQILPTVSPVDKSHRSGILLENSYNYFVSNNDISSPGINVKTNYRSYADTTVVGIRSILSNGTYECNDITEVGQCMRFEGACFQSYVFNNSFTTPAFDGFDLWNSGIIGPQGSNTASIGETWNTNVNGPFLGSGTFSLYSFPGASTPTSDLWVINTYPTNPPSNGSYPFSLLFSSPFQLSDGSLNYTIAGSPVACPAIPPPATAGTAQLQQIMQQIVQDSIPFSVFVPQSQYLSQQATLTQLNHDSTLLAGNTVLSALIQLTNLPVM